MSDSLWQRAVDYMKGLGYSAMDSQAIVGNLWHESAGLKVDAVGDGGRAYGLAQWHPDRQANFAKVFGKSIKGSSMEEQLQFVDWELNNTEINARNALLGANTLFDKVKTFMLKFERPANSSSLPKRVEAAGADQGGSAKGVTGAIVGAIDSVTGGWGSSTYQVFDGTLAARIVAVVVGVILIAIAIAAFTLTSDNAKQVIQAIK